MKWILVLSVYVLCAYTAKYLLKSNINEMKYNSSLVVSVCVILFKDY
jgi:hypothetical protein